MIKKFHYPRIVKFRIMDSVISPTLYLIPDEIKINNTVVSFNTDSNWIILENDPGYTSINIKISKSGYFPINQTINANVLREYLFVMVPSMQENQVAIVMRYQKVGTEHTDMDSHTVLFDSSDTKLGECFYSHPELKNTTTNINFDHDDVDGNNGWVETTRITTLDPSKNVVFVILDYDHKNAPGTGRISASRCNVEIQKGTATEGNILLDQFEVPAGSSQIIWEVCKFTGTTYQQLNTVTDINNYGITK